MTDLSRYLNAHAESYAAALSEIRNGRKLSHWMWYIFPQLAGLGKSYTSQHFAIRSLEEAKAYLQDPVLGAHMQEICEALLLSTGDAVEIFGSIDAKKLRSSMTLFAQADGTNPIFQQVLNKFYDGRPDGRTLGLLKQRKENTQ